MVSDPGVVRPCFIPVLPYSEEYRSDPDGNDLDPNFLSAARSFEKRTNGERFREWKQWGVVRTAIQVPAETTWFGYGKIQAEIIEVSGKERKSTDL